MKKCVCEKVCDVVYLAYYIISDQQTDHAITWCSHFFLTPPICSRVTTTHALRFPKACTSRQNYRWAEKRWQGPPLPECGHVCLSTLRSSENVSSTCMSSLTLAQDNVLHVSFTFLNSPGKPETTTTQTFLAHSLRKQTFTHYKSSDAWVRCTAIVSTILPCILPVYCWILLFVFFFFDNVHCSYIFKDLTRYVCTQKISFLAISYYRSKNACTFLKVIK